MADMIERSRQPGRLRHGTGYVPAAAIYFLLCLSHLFPEPLQLTCSSPVEIIRSSSYQVQWRDVWERTYMFAVDPAHWYEEGNHNGKGYGSWKDKHPSCLVELPMQLWSAQITPQICKEETEYCTYIHLEGLEEVSIPTGLIPDVEWARACECCHPYSCYGSCCPPFG